MQKILKSFQTIVSLSKRRGFIFQNSEIYGGLNSCWDYGPLGVELKMNVKKAWWESMTRRSDVVGLDASIFMHPKVWEASGHVESFNDPLVDCRNCKNRFKVDESQNKTCPHCGSHNLTEERHFNLMFQTYMGSVQDKTSQVYLRPETAQGIFVNFENVQQSMRKKLPFGIAQIGKSFRNEITPGNFIFRTREFEQMEMQFFISPKEDEKWFQKWKELRWQFYKDLGLNEKKLRFHSHDKKELAHYAKQAVDIQYEFPINWQELEGIHNRSDFDLSQHQKFSGKKLEYFDEVRKEKFIPYVVETALGCDRLCLALLCDAYKEESVGKDNRVVLKLHPKLAPCKIAVLPLSKKNELQETAHKIRNNLSQKWSCEYDESGTIGKRYRRQDEIGTPFCVTIDFQTKETSQVTVRDRDTMKQEKVLISQLPNYFLEKF